LFPDTVHSALPGAEVLRRFSGSEKFAAFCTFERGRSKIEQGPTSRDPLTLTWPTFTTAAEQAGMSRRGFFGAICQKIGAMDQWWTISNVIVFRPRQS